MHHRTCPLDKRSCSSQHSNTFPPVYTFVLRLFSLVLVRFSPPIIVNWRQDKSNRSNTQFLLSQNLYTNKSFDLTIHSRVSVNFTHTHTHTNTRTHTQQPVLEQIAHIPVLHTRTSEQVARTHASHTRTHTHKRKAKTISLGAGCTHSRLTHTHITISH